MAGLTQPSEVYQNFMWQILLTYLQFKNPSRRNREQKIMKLQETQLRAYGFNHRMKTSKGFNPSYLYLVLFCKVL